MAGHSKWAQIKRQKAVTDAKKSKMFGKLSRLITLESKKVRGDVSAPALRAVIEKAKSTNMPNENIDRAVKRGTGSDAGDTVRVLYESYGPGGAAIVIDGLTDNKNRTAQEIKHILSKNGAELAAQGAALWAFEKTGDGFSPQTTTPLSQEDGDALLKLLEELENHDDVQEVYTNAEFVS